VNRIKEALAQVPENATVMVDTALLNQYAYSKNYATEEEMDFINKMVELSYRKMPEVALRIVTTLPAEIHLERIRQRGRDIEEGVTLEHLQARQSLIDEAVAKFGNDVPTLYLDSSKFNWVDNEQDKQAILKLARKKLGL
jgi:deoxyadenosine/deoxycytidine kinase